MALLDVQGVSVRFGGIRALDDVDLDVDAGIVTGLIGPNGAGKTTLFDVVCGLQPTEAGTVMLDGVDLSSAKPFQRARMGISRTFQRLEVFGSLSVHDNVRVAGDIRRRWAHDGEDPRAVADELVARVGLAHVVNEPVDELPTGLSRLVELARALATRPRVLLLDEVSSGLDEGESDAMADLLLELAADGLAVLLVEHHVELVMRVCTKIHVLDFGRMLAVGTPDEIRTSAEVQQAYLGSVPV